MKLINDIFMSKFKILSLASLITWLLLIIFAIVELTGLIGENIGVSQSLKTSSFTRAMFIDIGILATIISIWVAFGTKEKLRFFFAIAILFVGSFAFLPFLSIFFWNKSK